MLRSLLPLLLLPTLSAVPNSALRVSCGDCNPFQAIQVILDGADLRTDASVHVVDIAPGRHNLRLVKWINPFKIETYYEGVVDFPPGTELRAKVTRGKLDIYGRGQWSAPVPPGAAFGPPRIVHGVQRADGGSAVRVARKVTLTGMKGQLFHHGCRLRARGGNWSDWTTSEAFTVPSDPYTTELSWDHSYGYLEDLGDSRRDVVEMAVFDHSNASLATSETTLALKRGRDGDRDREDDEDEEDDDRPRSRRRHHHRH
ncbi:MAG: hypothetical protein QM765_52895 [Myxococcales bacterium]